MREMSGLEQKELAADKNDYAAGAIDSLVGKSASAIATLRERIMSLPVAKRTWLIAAAAFITSVVSAMAWFASKGDWKPLFNGLESRDIQQVSQELATAGISYRTSPDGTGIEVPAEQIDKARMEVATKGMPQTGRLGFELFDKPNWVGSEFDEKVNYQRALEGELEHTIVTLGAVRSARVHLVLPEHSLFTSQDRAGKASVVLKLKRSSLSEEQIEAIRGLVAGAVDNLSPDNVALIDADGRLSFRKHSRSSLEADAEEAMEAKLVAMLEPLAGHDNVRATVNISYDEGIEQRTDEVYDPERSATLSLQKSEQTQTQPLRAMGIPGTASNSPAAAPSGAAQGSAAAAAPGVPPLLQKEPLPVYPQQAIGAGQSLRQENDTYGVTKHLVHTEFAPGRVQRVTAAIIVNDRPMIDGTGKTEHVVWKPRNADEMRRLGQLAQAAVGYDERRGDQVVVENVSFNSNTPGKSISVSEHFLEQARLFAKTQPGLLRTIVMSAIGLLIVLFVLRPVAEQVVATLRRSELPDSDRTIAVLAPPVSTVELAEPLLPASVPLPEMRMTKEQMQHRGIYEQVAAHIRKEPVQSTRLLEAWIGTPKESDL